MRDDDSMDPPKPEKASRETSELERQSWLPQIAAVIAAFMLVAGTIGPPILGQGVFLASDTLTQAYPWRAHHDPVSANISHHGPVGDTVDAVYPGRASFFDSLRDGEFLGWTPYVTGGKPHGTISASGVLNPFALTAYVLAPDWYAPALLKLLTMTAAIGFTFLFCRRLGTGRVPALFGGIAFAGSGFMVMWTNWQQPEVAAVIPALFWATERFLQRPRVVTALPVALAVASMLLGHFPAVTLYALYVLVPYVLVRIAMTRGPEVRAKLATACGAAAAVMAGILLVSAVLLPFALGLSDTGTGDRAEHPGNHLHVPSLLTAVAPKAFGLSTEGPDAAYFGPHNQVETIAFVGMTTALLAIAGLMLPRPATTPRGARGVMLAATAVLGWATFVGGDVLRVLQNLPAFDNSFVGRTRSILGFTVAVLAALGLQAISERLRPVTRRDLLVAASVAAAALGVSAIVAVRSLNLARAAERSEVLRSNLFLPALVGVLAIAAVVVLLRSTSRPGRLAALAALPLLFAAEGLILALPLLPNESRSTHYPTTPGIEFLQEHAQGERFAAESLTFYGSAPAVYGLRTATGHAFYANEWKEALDAVDPDAFSRSPTFPFLAGAPEVMGSPLLDRMGADWWAGSPTTPPPGERDPAPDDATVCDSTVPLTDDLTVELAPPSPDAGPQGLRGVVVQVCEATEVPFGTTVTAEVEGAEITGRSHLAGEVPAGELAVALPGDDMRDTGTAVVDLNLAGAGDQHLVLAADEQGEPIAGAIRPANDGLELVYADDLRIYRRTNSLGRIRWASRATVVDHPPQRLAELASGAVPADTVILSTEGPPGSGATATLDVTHESNDRITATVDADGDGYLVVADSIQSDWTAAVDGESAEIVAADHASAAVHVPAGQHEVELRYRPRGHQLGMWISLLTAAAVATAFGWDIRRTRRTSEAGQASEESEESEVTDQRPLKETTPPKVS